MTLALSGDLGTGKTTFTQGVAAGLGVSEQITSPTFTLVNEYTVPVSEADQPPNRLFSTTPLTLIHMDSYRLAGDSANDEAALDAATFGIDELFEIPRSLVIIEWAERLQSLLPPDRLEISLTYGADETEPSPAATGSSDRRFQVVATGLHSQAILSVLLEDPSLAETLLVHE